MPRWRLIAKPIIGRILYEHRNADEKKLRKALREAYPFGERRYYPYKVWLDEIKRQRGLKPRLLTDPKPTDPRQRNMFLSEPVEVFVDGLLTREVTIDDLEHWFDNEDVSDDLIGVPLQMAEEIESEPEVHDRIYESGTWTFYKFATVKGYVTVRWLGQSNGYYSESVDLAAVVRKERS